MKEKINPFISIADLMAGVTGVVMLLLVVSFVRSAAVSATMEQQRKQGVVSAISEIRKVLETSGTMKGIEVRDSVILLMDRSFESGSACLSADVEATLKNEVAPILADKLKKYPNIMVQIEGHTDAANVWQIATNLKEKCALFDDNYSLSAGRAREARRAVLSAVQGDSAFSRRIAVVGFGSDRLVNTKNPMAAENRRVEIRLVSRTF